MVNTSGNIIAGLSFLLIAGCSSFPKNHIHGVEYQTIDQSKVPYDLEEQVIYNDRQYFQEGEKTPETLPIIILQYNGTTRELDLDSSMIELQSKREYIPRKVESKEYGKDKWIDGVVLKRDGPYGIKANLTCLEQLKDEAEDSANESGFKVITTEDGASFAIRTIKILEKEYFFPRVEDNKINEPGKLNYYLIPVKGAKIKIENKCGNLLIHNENNIYRPIDPELFEEYEE